MSPSIRIAPVQTGTDPDLAEVEASIGAERGGRIPVLYGVLLNSPVIAAGWDKLLSAVRHRTQVRADLREMIILRIAALSGADFMFSLHAKNARREGVAEEKINTIKDVRMAAALFTDDEILVLELTDHMTRDVQVPGVLIARIRSRFEPRGAVELVATIGTYNMVVRFLVALDITW